MAGLSAGAGDRAPGRRVRVPVPEGRVATRIRGRGPPLLCLHGLSSLGSVWHRAAGRLSDAFTLHVPDLLGRGASGARPGVSYRLGAETARAAALARGFPDRGYLVAGHSHGAALAVALAAAAERGGRGAGGDDPPPGGPRAARDAGRADGRAGRVPRPAGLVLLNPVTPRTRRPWLLETLRVPAVRRAAARLLRPARAPLTRWVLEHRAFADPSLVDARTVRRYAAPWSDPARARTLLRVLADWRPAELSAHLPEAPPAAEVVAGARDYRIAPAEARRWAGRLGADFTLAGDAGHMLPEERPGLTAAAVRRVAGRAGWGA